MSSAQRPSFSLQGFRVPPLQLRPPKLDDLQAVTALHSDPRTNIHNPAGASTPEKCQEQLNAWVLDWERDQLGYWIIQECGSGEILGVGGVRKTGEKLHERAMLNLYYRFSPDAWGRGMATTLALTAIDAARTLKDSLTVSAIIHPENLVSQRVAEKLGSHCTNVSLTARAGVTVGASTSAQKVPSSKALN